jgi:tRNA 2-thiouridine synthesizing protein A
MIEVNAKGFSCPIPMVRSKKAMDENPGKNILVIVDETAQKDNVSRLAENNGYSVNVNELDTEYRLELIPPKK